MTPLVGGGNKESSERKVDPGIAVKLTGDVTKSGRTRPIVRDTNEESSLKSKRHTRKEALIARVIAEDAYLGLARVDSRNVQGFIARVNEAGGKNRPSRFIKIRYESYEPNNSLPSDLLDSNKVWKFTLSRNESCDQRVADDLFQVPSNGAQLPKAGTYLLLENAGQDLPKIHSMIPCFVLRPGGVKPIKNKKRLRGIVAQEIYSRENDPKAFVASAAPPADDVIKGQIIAYRPAERVSQAASHVLNEESFLLSVNTSKPQPVVRLVYQHFGYSKLGDDLLSKTPTLQLSVRRDATCDQTYGAFVQNAAALSDDRGKSDLAKKVIFIGSFQEIKLAPKSILKCYKLQSIVTH